MLRRRSRDDGGKRAKRKVGDSIDSTEASNSKKQRLADKSDQTAGISSTTSNFQEADSVREQARPYRLATAQLPISALTYAWSIGTNRKIDRQHAQELCSLFLKGRLERRAQENHLLVLCSSRDVEQMMAYLTAEGMQGRDEGEPTFFREWLTATGGRKAELMAGQHRVEALKEYVRRTGGGEEDLWWTCEFYDRGTQAHIWQIG
jgi:hypothetical protein